MNDVYRFVPNQPVVWYHRNPAHSNQYCLYCGVFVGKGSILRSNEEHLIGRRFVPRGYLSSTDFNFLFRACKRCNSDKAEIERHVSSVTLFNSPERMNPEIDRVARRKGGSDYHPGKPGSLVKDSGDTHSLVLRGRNLEATFGLSSPPQPDPLYVESLALFQVQALFSLVTSSNPLEPENTRLLPQKNIFVFGHFGHGDWGNEQLLTAAQRTKHWPVHVNVRSARGFFKALLRRGPASADGWFWALEWNRELRLVGGIGDAGVAPRPFVDLPEVEWHSLPDGMSRIRRETPLSPAEDDLFEGR